MYKMHMELKNNGSATVELCLVVPVFLFVVCMFIGAFIKVMNEGIVQGKGYANLLCCDFRYDEGAVEDYFEGIYSDKNGIPGACLMDVESNKGIIRMVVCGSAGGISVVSNTEGLQLELKHEDRAVDRLRRWQIYGDVLWE